MEGAGAGAAEVSCKGKGMVQKDVSMAVELLANTAGSNEAIEARAKGKNWAEEGQGARERKEAEPSLDWG